MIPPSFAGKTPLKRIYNYLASAGLVALASLVAVFFLDTLDHASLAMFYLMRVVLSGLRYGPGGTVMASILSVAAYDFFIIQPRFQFTVAVGSHIASFLELLIVGLVISALAQKTKQRALEAQERELQAEVLRGTERLQTALLNSVSHDLKTPLVSITGALDVLMQDPSLQEAGPRRDLLENAHEESNRLNRLVGNLLHMTRVESGKLRINPEPCELSDVICAALEQLRDKIDKAQVHLDISPDLPEVPMDPILMTGVFVNLIDNAAKFSDPSAPIEITAKLLNETICIEVKDQGSGIPPSDLKLIFDKFYRALHPKRVNGTGLGLSICKGVVEAHGGVISAQNNPDKGATLKLILPLKRLPLVI